MRRIFIITLLCVVGAGQVFHGAQAIDLESFTRPMTYLEMQEQIRQMALRLQQNRGMTSVAAVASAAAQVARYQEALVQQAANALRFAPLRGLIRGGMYAVIAAELAFVGGQITVITQDVMMARSVSPDTPLPMCDAESLAQIDERMGLIGEKIHGGKLTGDERNALVRRQETLNSFLDALKADCAYAQREKATRMVALRAQSQKFKEQQAGMMRKIIYFPLQFFGY